MYISRLNRIPSGEIPKKITKVLNEVGLENAANLKVGKFSRGMKQRLGMANILIKEPKVMLLDEPTQGLDLKGATEMLDLFQNINTNDNVTILISSHLIHQMGKICKNIGIMVNGNMVIQSEVGNLKFNLKSWLIEIEALNINDHILNEINYLKGVIEINRFGNKLMIHCDSDLRSTISKILVMNGASLKKLIVKNDILEEIYKKYTGGT